MRYAEAGYNLEIDLSRGGIEKVETDPELARIHLGGQGTALKILWDRVPPEVDPFSPDNLLIFSAGLFHATPVPGANRTIVSTFSPVTNFYAHSIFGGFFGPEMKFAGYDNIVIRGKASGLVYLWIYDDEVEIRDAAHLHGKGALETAELIQEELGQPEAQVAAIGLAGENRVYMAAIEHSNSSASRLVGVVMGDKRLKAIVVRGTKKDIHVAHPDELFQECLNMHEEINEKNWEYCGDLMAHEQDESFHLNHFAWGNARQVRRDYWDEERQKRWTGITESFRVRLTGCYNCGLPCHAAIKMPGRQLFFTKCYSKLTYAMAAFKEIDFDYDFLAVAQEYGLDGYSTPQVLAFAVELYEAGILTDKDLPEFPEDSGERFYYLLEKVVHREGIGDVLANGVYRAARQIGKGAEAYDHNTIKKVEQLPLKLGMINYPYYLMYCTSEKMTITQAEGSYPQGPIPDKKEREEFVKNWEAAPERFKKWLMEWEPRQHPPIEASVNICDWNEIMHYIDDALGICAFLGSFRGQFGGRPPYHIYNLPKFISLATGMDIDDEELWRIASRNRNLLRALNIRRGLTREVEKPPEDHWRKRDPETEKKTLDAYYKFKGWTLEGIPTKETLDGLGLDYVAQDLLERGFLKDDRESASDGVSSKEG
ncbi:MAG: aldehyde ferredoxin oxidoreductase N-terminal domain-containing protein [Desulfatiglans sp.]|jgi:aldehyde:ferredoxin oxidoreductase|nr:aldehyde ferredoxin oxidoreductase N-terminal domain-containing protein [Desulfatiglans sp.]